MNYENLTFKDLQYLLKHDKNKFYQLPIEIVRKIVAEECVKRNTVHIDDSSITLKEEYPYENTPEKITFESSSINKGKLIKIYLEKKGKKYSKIGKTFASHVLEQVFDEDNQLISEELKPFKME